MNSGTSGRASSSLPVANGPGWPVRFASPAAFVAGILVITGIAIRTTGLLPRHHPLELSLYALSDLLIVVALVSLWRTRACGDGVAARIGLGMAALGYTLDVPGELLTEVSPRTANVLSGGGTLMFALGLIIAGICMLRARRWHGWHRFVLLGLGAYVPVVLMPSIMLRQGPNVAFALLGVLYLVLSLALRAEQSSAERVASVSPPER